MFKKTRPAHSTIESIDQEGGPLYGIAYVLGHQRVHGSGQRVYLTSRFGVWIWGTLLALCTVFAIGARLKWSVINYGTP